MRSLEDRRHCILASLGGQINREQKVEHVIVRLNCQACSMGHASLLIAKIVFIEEKKKKIKNMKTKCILVFIKKKG